MYAFPVVSRVSRKKVSACSTLRILNLQYTHVGQKHSALEFCVNECTKVQNPRRTRVYESLKAHALDL